ncbi:hypothetical protein WG922_18265 [Ramlibacter sp. AN1015]|uniref:hypothetical protein n=1 Tax=Ramlibacter sp. AN1015 TaxID=3133428 RepID=UPI0030C02D56
MSARNALAVLGLLLGGAAAAAHAEAAPPCEGEPAALDPLLQRAAVIAHYASQPDACRKALFRECAAAARQDLLDVGSAVICSMRYEGLLRGSFRGDFDALMQWWRAQRTASGR